MAVVEQWNADVGWRLTFQHAFDVVFCQGEEREGVAELLALSRHCRDALDEARATCAAIVAEWPHDADARQALHILEAAVSRGDESGCWRPFP